MGKWEKEKKEGKKYVQQVDILRWRKRRERERELEGDKQRVKEDRGKCGRWFED